jgi:hypothetical protein
LRTLRSVDAEFPRYGRRPRNDDHSPAVKRSTGPSGSLLSRRPTTRPRPATSTQLPLEKLYELLTQRGPDPDASGALSNVGLSTTTSLIVVCVSTCTERALETTKSSHLFSESSSPCFPLSLEWHKVYMNVCGLKGLQTPQMSRVGRHQVTQRPRFIPVRSQLSRIIPGRRRGGRSAP